MYRRRKAESAHLGSDITVEPDRLPEIVRQARRLLPGDPG
jgi:hypothetical protein